MGGILDKLDEWLRGLLIEGITGNLSGMFDTVNTKVGEIAGEVGQTPLAWNSGVFSMIRNLSETVIVPIAGVILTFVSADWANQPRIMRKAIETAVEWDFRQDNGFSYAKDELERRQMATLSLTLSVLTEMCCAAKPWSYQGMAVDRIMALERINGVLRAEQGSLAPFVEDFIDIFIGTADANHPSNSKGYMRALLWDHLARYLVEQENL